MFYRAIPQPPSGLHNLFFAVRPPADVCERIGEQTAAFASGGKPMRSDRLHVTLLQLVCEGVVPHGLAEEAAEVAGLFRSAPFTVMFDRLVAADGRMLMLPSEPLTALYRLREQLGFMLKRAGVEFRMDRAFQPHVTTLYDNRISFDTPVDPIIWKVEEFVLIDSHVGKTRHEQKGSWPLSR